MMRGYTFASFAEYAPGRIGRKDTRTIHPCCFKCPVPDECDQTHPDCPIRQGVYQEGDLDIDVDGNPYNGDVKVSGYLTTRQASKLLGIAPESVAHRCQRGTLPGRKIGRQWVIPVEAIK